MFRLVPASRAVRCARLASLAVVIGLCSTGSAQKPSRASPTEAKNREGDFAAAFAAFVRSAALVGKKDSFQSGGKKIRVRLFEPAGGGKYPVVVMLPGQDGWGQMAAYKFATQDLVDTGHVVVLIQYYDRTDTPQQVPPALQAAFEKWLKEGAPKDKKNTARDHFEEWIAAVGDAVAYARQLPNVDAKRVGIVGFSLGGYLALSAAPRCQPPVAAVVEMFGGIPKEKREGLGMLPPTLIAHGDKDDVVHVDEACLAFGLLKVRKQPVEVHILKDAGHACCTPGTTDPDFLKLLEARTALTKHFRTHLGYAEAGTTFRVAWMTLKFCAAEGVCPPVSQLFLRVIETRNPSYHWK